MGLGGSKLDWNPPSPAPIHDMGSPPFVNAVEGGVVTPRRGRRAWSPCPASGGIGRVCRIEARRGAWRPGRSRWKTAKTVLQCYQRADEGQLRKALEARRRPCAWGSQIGGSQDRIGAIRQLRWSDIDSEAGICRDHLILRDFYVEFPPFDSRQMRFQSRAPRRASRAVRSCPSSGLW